MDSIELKQIVSQLQELNKTVVAIEKWVKFLIGEKQKKEKKNGI